MRRFAAVATFLALAIPASAQKVMVPSQSSNPNLIITPAQQPNQISTTSKRSTS